MGRGKKGQFIHPLCRSPEWDPATSLVEILSCTHPPGHGAQAFRAALTQSLTLTLTITRHHWEALGILSGFQSSDPQELRERLCYPHLQRFPGLLAASKD